MGTRPYVELKSSMELACYLADLTIQENLGDCFAATYKLIPK